MQSLDTYARNSTYAPLIEKRLRPFRKPHCGSMRIDETYIKIRGQWRYLYRVYRVIDKHGTPVDFLLTATRDLHAGLRRGIAGAGSSAHSGLLRGGEPDQMGEGLGALTAR
jgi:hypothetical protein